MTEEKFNNNYDVFRSFLVKNAFYDGYIEIPKIKTSDKIPKKLIPFSKAVACKNVDYDSWVMFYEYDEKFVRLWNNPKKYLDILKKFNGIISPDFSLYRNMPLVMQMWSKYQGHALAVWLEHNGIEIIPNVRWNDERTYGFCFDGIEKNSTVSIGTHGCIKSKKDRQYFKKGLSKMIEVLSPKTIIVYGRTPDEFFAEHRNNGINIISFESEFSKSRRRVTA